MILVISVFLDLRNFTLSSSLSCFIETSPPPRRVFRVVALPNDLAGKLAPLRAAARHLVVLIVPDLEDEHAVALRPLQVDASAALLIAAAGFGAAVVGGERV